MPGQARSVRACVRVVVCVVVCVCARALQALVTTHQDGGKVRGMLAHDHGRLVAVRRVRCVLERLQRLRTGRPDTTVRECGLKPCPINYGVQMINFGNI